MAEKYPKKDIKRGQKIVKTQARRKGSGYTELSEDGKVISKDEYRAAKASPRRVDNVRVNHLAQGGKKRKPL